MTVLLDTSVLAAFLNPKDERHSDAKDIMRRSMRGALGVPIATEFVLNEGLTLLRKRPGDRRVSERFRALFYGTDELRAPLRLHSATRDEIDRAVAIHFEQYDRSLSLTDCHLIVMSRALGAPVASFDDGFDGIVPRVGR